MKGFMIFMEGGEIPKCVHATYTKAMGAAHSMAQSFPDREIVVMQIHRRLMRPAQEKKAISLGSHMPDERVQVNRSELITHDKLAA